ALIGSIRVRDRGLGRSWSRGGSGRWSSLRFALSSAAGVEDRRDLRITQCAVEGFDLINHPAEAESAAKRILRPTADGEFDVIIREIATVGERADNVAVGIKLLRRAIVRHR